MARAFPHSLPHRVAVLVLDTMVPFDLGVPCQVPWNVGGTDDVDGLILVGDG